MKVRAYIGSDMMSKLTEQVLREFKSYMRRAYGINIEVEVVEVGGSDLSEFKVPTVTVNDKIISSGGPPSLAKLVDEVFNSMELEYGVTLGFPLINGDLEEYLASSL